MASDTAWFLEQLFGTKDADAYILIWALGEHKLSMWFSDIELAGEAAQDESRRKRNAYLGVGLSQEDHGPYRRATASTVYGIPGLWADIDLEWEGAKPGKRRPPTLEDARSLLNDLPEPSITVHSGHGLQCWWLFPEVWHFQDATERLAAAALAESWTRLLQNAAAAQDYSIDSTFDLSRVMRLPGTLNYKAEPVPVRLISEKSATVPRYTVETLSKVAANLIVEPTLAEQYAQEPITIPTSAQFVMRPDATPPFDKFEAMMFNQPQFARSWNRQRKDLTDRSASGYDMSLAILSVRAGWSDQEVVDLLIANRRRHNDSPKLRADYFLRTLARARANARLDDPVEAPEDKTPPSREEMLKQISHLLGVEVNGLIKFMSSPPRYRMVANGTGFMVGEVNDLIMQNRLRTVMAAELGIYIQNYKGQQWSNIAQMMLNACEEQEVSAEETERGSVESWLLSYLSEKTILENKDEACVANVPFSEEGIIYFFSNDLRKWLQLNRFEMVQSRTLAALLSAYGCEPRRVYPVIRGIRTTRAAWKLPDDWGGSDDESL